MTPNSNENVSITFLVASFRNALLAIRPICEQVGIPWRRVDAYDDWDRICTSLYDSLVRQPICFGALNSDRLDCVHPYDVVKDNYSESGIVEVLHPKLLNGTWKFNAFGTRESPFDVVEAWRLKDGVAIDSGCVECSFADSRFVFAPAGRAGDGSAIDEINLTTRT